MIALAKGSAAQRRWRAGNAVSRLPLGARFRPPDWGRRPRAAAVCRSWHAGV